MQLALKPDPPPLREDAYGVLRVCDTCVTLGSLVDLYDQGASAEEIALSFEALDLSQVYAALGYYLIHRQMLDEHLRAEREAGAAGRDTAERRCPRTALRSRLAARRRMPNASPPR
ncbi:MAG: DUF433 domain-containing protein [Chromatiaceae bacterium]